MEQLSACKKNQVILVTTMILRSLLPDIKPFYDTQFAHERNFNASIEKCARLSLISLSVNLHLKMWL